MSRARNTSPPPPAVRAVRELFRREYKVLPAHVILAPGRVELLGNHTDYNDGLVLAAAIDRHVAIGVSPRQDGRISLVSSAFPGRAVFPFNQVAKDPATPWADHVKGVLLQLRARGVHFTGFDAAIASDLPAGAGLSSSAALAVATALAVRALHPYRLGPAGLLEPPARGRGGVLPPPDAAEKRELARLCRAAEQTLVGVQCGLLDPISCLFGKAQHAIELDCQSVSVETVPLPGAVMLVVCPSGVTHALAGGEYNALRAECEGAARALGVKALRAVDPARLAAGQDRLTPRQHECARHVVSEIQRVVAGTRALRDGDLEQFGQYLGQSHASSRDGLRNSCPELDRLVELAERHPACLGARLTGGGFGGATVSMVRCEGTEAFLDHMIRGWAASGGGVLKPLCVQTGDGAREESH